MRVTLIAATLVIAIAGCAGRYGYSVRYHAGADYANIPPPEPLVEVIPTSPGPGYAWVNGYWAWDGDDYHWVRGHWDVAPGEGYVWYHHGYTYDDGRYRLRPGRWVRRGYRPPYTYVHPRPRVEYGDRYVVRRPGVIVEPPPPRRVYVEPPPRNVYVQPPPRNVYVEPPPRVVVRPPQPHVRVEPPRSRVVVRPPEPHVRVAPPHPHVRVEPPRSRVVVRPPEPHVRVAPPHARPPGRFGVEARARVDRPQRFDPRRRRVEVRRD